MPPKRRSDASVTADSSKKTKNTPSGSSSSFNNETRWSSKSRYSAVSNSRNVDLDYKKTMEDPEHAFTYICRCPLGTKPARGGNDDDEEEDDWEDEDEFDEDEDDDDDDDDDDEEDDDGKPEPKCDGGKSGKICLCGKLAADHPDAPFVITRAGFRKMMDQQVKCQVRDPDCFGMYTYNDHMAYGIIEVIENLILDFEEACQSWKEQWVVCEAIAPFIWYLTGADFGMCEDGDRAKDVAKLVGVMFLTMLARLEREGQMKSDSEVRDLGMVMAGMIKTAESFRDFSLLEDHDETRKSKARPFPYVPSQYDSYVAAYAKKYNIKFSGVRGIKKLTEDLDDEVELPTAEEHGEDPWGFKASLKEYKSKVGKIGGDKLDITSWKPAERKEASFDRKDPLPRSVIDGIKRGEVVSQG